MRKCFSTITNILYKLVIILLPSIPYSTEAQGKDAILVDSLLQQLQHLPDDSNKVILLCNLSSKYYLINISEGLRRGEEALALAEKLSWQTGIAKAYRSIGSNYWANSEFLKAHNYYLKSLKIDETLGDKKEIAKSLHSVGVSYASQFDKSKAIEYFSRALILYEEAGDSASVMGCNLNIGEIYENEKNISKSLEYYNRALQIADTSKQTKNLAFILNIIGRTYASQNNYSKALEYERKSIKIFTSLGINNDLALQFGNAGEVFFILRDYSNSLVYFKKAIKTFRKVKNRGEMSHYGAWYGAIGKIEIILYKNESDANSSGNNRNSSENKLINQAINNLKKALSIFESVVAWSYSEEFNKTLSEAYSLKGNFVSALYHFKISANFKDSIYNIEKHDQIARLEMEYEYNKKKDSLIYQANLQNFGAQRVKDIKLLLFIGSSVLIFILLCLIGSYLFFRYRKQQLNLKNQLILEKVEKQLKETEYQQKINDLKSLALSSQMNPHFIFNALNTIQSFIYLNDKKSASLYLGKFSELIRKILENSSKQSISLSEEVELLQLYLDIEKVRFGEKFYSSINISPDVDMQEIYIPPMLLQPYVENAIKHGLLHLAENKNLIININKSVDEDYVEIIIDDNGIGREKSILLNKNREGHQSFAIEATEKRIELLNHLNYKKATLQIIDKKGPDGYPTGTKVIINIPSILMASV